MNHRILLVIAFAISGCVETEVVTPPTPMTMPARIKIPEGFNVPTRERAGYAMEGARKEMERGGFEFDVSSMVGSGSKSDVLAMANRPDDPQLCGGTAEVIAVAAVEQSGATMLRISCQTEHLIEPAVPGDPCQHTEWLGCPNGGDRIVAAIAVNAVSTL